MAKQMKQKTAKELFDQTAEQQAKEDLKYQLEDAETDLKRAIENGEREVSNLERGLNEKVKAYVQGGSLQDLLKYEQDIAAKKEDIKRLQSLMNTYFPAV